MHLRRFYFSLCNRQMKKMIDNNLFM